MADIADTATEVVAEVADEVADQASSLANASRGLAGRDLSLIFGGMVFGIGLGAAGGYIFARKRLETKYNQIAEDEIAEMREHYRAKSVALENTVMKPELDDIVREQGYSVEPPMAVAPPTSVNEAARAAREEDEAADEEEPTNNADDLEGEPEVQNIFEKDDPQEGGGWDYHVERSRRSPLKPYVIHRDEKNEHDAYEEMTYTYYEADDVLCNERDEVIAGQERDALIGEANLERFGDGSGDPSIVYIRNDKLEAVIEVVRSPNSYAEEVHGFSHSDTPYPRRRRHFDDDE